MSGTRGGGRGAGHGAGRGDASAGPGGAVRLVGLEKAFGDVRAVRGIDLDIAAGEFFSLLGPSGCGKTTTLRLVAGFEPPTAGRILLDGRDLAHVPPDRRPVNTVFQDYALFPFASVHDNVAFGLRYTGADKAERRRRVGEALDLVQMGAYARRRPAQLSGGQRQRVALARALVLRPRVLLLDEPLGALDAKLRRTLQIELKALQEAVGVTFLYVTHDQEEALTMSDRMAVMAGGRVEQVGTPAEVYSEPATAHVADFLGAANVWDVEVLEASAGSGARARLGGAVVEVARHGVRDGVPGAGSDGGPVRMVARPERLRVSAAQDAGGPNRVAGVVERLVYLGASLQAVVRLGDGTPVVVEGAGDGHLVSLRRGDPVCVTLDPGCLRLLPLGGT